MRVVRLWTSLGNFKQVVSQLSIYFSVYSMIATTFILWRTVIKPLIDEYQLHIPMWWFILALGVMALIAGFLERHHGMPGFFRSWTQQFYTPDNPMRQNIEKIMADVEELKNKRQADNHQHLPLLSGTSSLDIVKPASLDISRPNRSQCVKCRRNYQRALLRQLAHVDRSRYHNSSSYHKW